MARYLPLLSWLLIATSIILITLLNTAGTHIHDFNHPAQWTIFLEQYAPLSMTIPFFDLNNSTNYAWSLNIYLNAVAVAPVQVYDEETGPTLLQRGIAKPFPLHRDTISVFAPTSAAPPNYTMTIYANATLDNVHLDHTIDWTVAPFVFYTFAVAQQTVLLVSIILVHCAENFAESVHVCLAVGAFLSSTIGNAIVVGKARSVIHELRHNSSRAFVTDLHVMGGFLGLGWGAAVASLGAGIVLCVDARYDVVWIGGRRRIMIRVRERPQDGWARFAPAVHGVRQERNNGMALRERRRSEGTRQVVEAAKQ
jgi:hypothetical protein